MKRGKYVVFELGQRLYGIPEEDVLEIGEINNRCSIPFNPKIIHEVINHHGRIIPLVDLYEFLNLTSSDKPGYFILIEGDKYNLGLGVNSILGLVENTDFLSGETPEFIEGILKISERRVNVINTEKIFNAIKNYFKEES